MKILEKKSTNLLLFLCKEFYKNSLPDLSIFELGYQLAMEIKQIIKQG